MNPAGAVTVEIADQVLVLAVQADGAEVTTIEGVASNGDLHAVQEGFWERHFFADELRLRVVGRLTHWRDRLDGELLPVEDLWLTDVVIEGGIGDAVLYVRFLDMLERADEVEPGRYRSTSRQT